MNPFDNPFSRTQRIERLLGVLCIWLFMAVLMLLFADAHAGVSGEWRVNLVRTGGTTVATVRGETEAEAWASCRAQMATLPAREYDCQTMRYHGTVTADPLPPAAVDCAGTWSEWTPIGAWSACVAGQQLRDEQRTFTVTRPPANGGAACPSSPETRQVSQSCVEPPPPSGATRITYTDLAFAPPGAFVTVFGFGLDAEVAGADVVSRTSTKTVLKWKGDGATIGGQAVPVATRAGRVREATPSTLTSVCSSVQSGDVIYLRAGNYTARCGSTYNGRQFGLGGAFQNVAIVGYPGELATVRDAYMGDGSRYGDGAVIANLQMSGWDCVFGASWWESEESGAKNVRVVNNDCRGTYGNNNTMTGQVAFGGDGWKVLGNRFSNNASSPINNNHAVYVNVGADDVEIAWNTFSNMKMGHVIQQHTDGPLRKYERLSIHDNELRGVNAQDIRGINISGCTSDSTADIYNNVLINLGQNFSGINVYCGKVEIRHNTLNKIAAPTILNRGGNVTARNNILIGSAASGVSSQSNNVTSGAVDDSGRPATPTKAPNAGVDVDHAGAPRGATVTVGAYE